MRPQPVRVVLLGALVAVPLLAFGIARSGVLPLPRELVLRSGDARLAAIVQVPESDRAPFPAVVLVHGSGRVTAREMLEGAGSRLNELGLAALAYDKRGVGSSTGEYSSIGPANSERMFDLLGADALAAVAALRARRDIDRKRIGLLGISQGGWIAPLAASRSADVAFVISISGPAVSVGEEIAYSRLAGDDPGSEQGLSDAEIDRRMALFRGPHGYDPVPVLRRLTVPSLWIVGERDRSIPVRRTVDTLDRLRRMDRRPITTYVVAGADHRLRNRDTSAQPDFWSEIERWLTAGGIIRQRRP